MSETTQRRLLIVSPHFPPVNAPDMQRVRMSLPYFVEAGWDVVVLTVNDPRPLAPIEPELESTVPAAIKVVRAPCFSRNWTRWIGINSPALRAVLQIYYYGRRLLVGKSIDLVYFSTTQFIMLPLGRLWRAEFGVPYVIDLQDPWRNDFYSQPGAPHPPGGWKYRFADAQARMLEGWTFRRAAHVISVSERYLRTLDTRYPWFKAIPRTVLTFGAPNRDSIVAREKARTAPPLLPTTSSFKIGYAGRLGDDMIPALEILFSALGFFRHAARPIEVFFFGSSYAEAGRAMTLTTTLAERHGIADLVHEQPARIGYIDSLRLLIESDITLLLGSADSAYSPSKLYPTLLAGKPSIAIAPARSVLEDKLTELGGAALVVFDRDPAAFQLAVERLRGAFEEFLRQPGSRLGSPLQAALLEQKYSAAAIAKAQLEIFSSVLEQNGRQILQ